MSSLVLLNHEGIVTRKLQLVSLPIDYVVPRGMTISWMSKVHLSSSDPFAAFNPKEPAEAYFYLGNAFGVVERSNFKITEQDNDFRLRFGSRDLTMTVQGTVAKDVVELRDRILQLVHSSVRWEASNDLNPKPRMGFWQKIKRIFS